MISEMEGPIAVLGGDGFIGSNLVNAILRKRQDVYAIGHHYKSWKLHKLPSDHYLVTDVCSPTQVWFDFKTHRFKTIFYLASYGNSPTHEKISQIYDTNVYGLSLVFENAVKHGYSAFVHAGTSSEYGINSHFPHEGDPVIPNSHYSLSKIMASNFIRYVEKKAINLRFYSVYGPHEPEYRLIPEIIRRGSIKKLPDFGNPDVSRDFVYVDDVVEALILGATKGVKELPGRSVNIATGIKTTIKDIAILAKDIFGIKGKPKFNKRANHYWDRTDWVGDPSLAKVMGWKPKTSLKDGIIKTWQWTKILPEDDRKQES